MPRSTSGSNVVLLSLCCLGDAQGSLSSCHPHSTTSKGKLGRDEGPVSDIADWLMQDAWLICFDEFQVTDVGTAATLMNLFRCIFQRGAVVVTTSNRKLDDLYQDEFQKKNFAPLVDLLKTHCQEHSLDSKTDYRLRMFGEP